MLIVNTKYKEISIKANKWAIPGSQIADHYRPGVRFFRSLCDVTACGDGD